MFLYFAFEFSKGILIRFNGKIDGAAQGMRVLHNRWNVDVLGELQELLS